MAISYLIAGPIKGRNAKDPLIQINTIAQHLYEDSVLNRILIASPSVKDLDLVSNLEKNIEFIPVEDIGQDCRKQFPWRERAEWNLSRMYESVVKGLEFAKTDWTLKTRIELLPDVENARKHLDLVTSCIRRLEKIGKGSLVFLEEDYWGPSKPRKGVMYWIPDTFQIMKTSEMVGLWTEANTIARQYVKSSAWNGKHGLASEQILGISYFKKYLDDKLEVPSYRFTFKLKHFLKLRDAEKYLFLIHSYSEFSLQESKFTKRNLTNANIYRENMDVSSGIFPTLVKFIFYRLLNKRFKKAFGLFLILKRIRMFGDSTIENSIN